MNWKTKINILAPGALSHYQIWQEERKLTFREVFTLWREDNPFRLFYNQLIADSPFSAFYWEHPCLTQDLLGEDYEFVLVNSSALALIHNDPTPFKEKFVKDQLAIRFANLRADAELVAPTPQGKKLEAFTHLANFVRQAETDQQAAFWELVGTTAVELISEEARWLSTSGLGVHWLHVRFDSRPKYYTHRPYAKP